MLPALMAAWHQLTIARGTFFTGLKWSDDVQVVDPQLAPFVSVYVLAWVVNIRQVREGDPDIVLARLQAHGRHDVDTIELHRQRADDWRLLHRYAIHAQHDVHCGKQFAQLLFGRLAFTALCQYVAEVDYTKAKFVFRIPRKQLSGVEGATE